MSVPLVIKRCLCSLAVLGLAVLGTTYYSAPATASVTRGEHAFHDGNYADAIREFNGPAASGDPIAQYYMAVLALDGLGTPQNAVNGFGWLLCAQTGSLPTPLASDAARRYADARAVVSKNDLTQSRRFANQVCDFPLQHPPESTDTNDILSRIIPQRGPVNSVLFFPGDTAVTGAVVAFQETGLDIVTDWTVGLFQEYGDLLFGLLSLFGWLALARLAYVVLKALWESYGVVAREAAKRRESDRGDNS